VRSAASVALRIARRIATAIGLGGGDTRAGEIELQIPKIRKGSYFPSFLQPRKRSEQALVSVVQQAYVCGVSTRRVDQLVESLGLRWPAVAGGVPPSLVKPFARRWKSVSSRL
jgi:hypothetical protein